MSKYIVLEGLDGCGKTTQQELAVDWFKSMGHQAEAVTEPGTTEIGKQLRPVIKSPAPRSPESNLDLFTVTRRELFLQIVGPLVAERVIVVADRSWVSTEAYQGAGEGLDKSLIRKRSEEALGKYFLPDCGVIIDVDLDTSRSRVSERGDSDYFEQKGEDFFARVRDGYLAFADEYGWPVINGTQSIEKVYEDIKKAISESEAVSSIFR